ncbi:oligosaccharide flippase family protein [Planococcus shenhongbingii]|uniref:lipopolysaccharide biosynthesis protein n=1 Tax=Planococcus shenhongbingii TaxID=3058398 RepID=UPI0026236A60|nr:oligosaccharide flippase family protein [Planococcus sp. N016]WKA57757.1 oligosaccharide flippase family protein [Planococcus sp. N016]
MRSQVEKLTNKPFVRNVIVVATGTAMAQIVYMALSPIITRLYGPEAYGLMGAFMAIVIIVGPVSALTYPIAIVLPKKEEDTQGLIQLSFLISMFSAGFLSIMLLLFYNQIINLFNLEDISPFLFLLPFVALFSGVLQIAESWLIRTKQFKVTAKVAVLQALLLQGSMVFIGVFYPNAAVLIFLSTFGIGLKAAMMIALSNKRENFDFKLKKKRIELIKKLAFTHKDFPLYRAPEVFIDAVSQGLPIILLASFFGPASAGFYSIGYTVLSIPSQLIGKSVGDVFYPRISEAANNGEKMTNLIKKATYYLGVVGILPYIIVIFYGPALFRFVFGDEWGMAGEYARWIALWSFFKFLNKASVTALPALSAQAFQLCSTIVTLVSRIAALVIGFYVYKSDLIAIALFSITGAILNVVFIAITLHISKKHDQKI